MSRGSTTISIRLAISALMLTCLAGACGSDDPKGATLSGNTPCEKVASLAAQKGCAAPVTCNAKAECASLDHAWLDCIARDLAQCICEAGDRSVNCEGSYKPDEGPALCVNEAMAATACYDP
jgi:hypothetical protein